MKSRDRNCGSLPGRRQLAGDDECMKCNVTGRSQVFPGGSAREVEESPRNSHGAEIWQGL